MNNILVLILSWLPVPIEFAGIVLACKFLSKKVKETVSEPSKAIKASEKVSQELSALNAKLKECLDLNCKLLSENEQLRRERKGLTKYEK